MANNSKAAKTPSLSQLRAENARLKKQNEELAKKKAASSNNSTPKSGRGWLTALVVVAAGAAGALLVVGNLIFWGGNTLVNTDRFVAVTSPLIKQPAIQTAVASYTTQQLFLSVNVDGYIKQALPPKAEFLAPTLSSQLKSSLNSTLKSLLQNPSVQKAWTEGLTRSHSQIISLAKSYQGNGNINLNDFYNALSKKLEGTNLSFLANKTLPSKIGSITVVKAPWLPKLHKLVTDIGWYQGITTILFLGLSFVAVWFSKNRRKMVVALGLIDAALMLVSIIAIRLTGHDLISKVNPTYQAAASEAGEVISRPLIIQTVSILLLGLVVAFSAWISGNSRPAQAVKRSWSMILSGKLHEAAFGKKENVITKWFGAHKRTLQWLYVGLIAIIVLLVTLSPKLIIIYAIILLLGLIVIEFLSADNKK